MKITTILRRKREDRKCRLYLILLLVLYAAAGHVDSLGIIP